MYFNIVSLKSGCNVSFHSSVPFSIDKVTSGWNVITDESNGSIINILGEEIAFIVSSKDKVRDGTVNRGRGLIINK